MPCKPEDWARAAQQRGLLSREPSREGAGMPVYACGVSLAYLELLAGSLKEHATALEACSDSCSTAGVMQRMLLPVSRMAGKTRLWDVIPPEHTGTPQWYVVHSWSASFSETVASITESLAPDPRPGEPPWPAGHKAGIMIWIDLFAVNHSAAPREHAETAAMIVEAQVSCGQGVLLSVDRSLCVLNRGWPLYELYLYLYYAQQPNFHIALPGGMGISDVLRLQEVCRLFDISRAETTRPQDKTSLMSEVKRTWGLQRTNRQLQEELITALYCRLRWTSRPEDKGNLAALLLQQGELAQLQLLLCSLPGLKSDDEALQEIRDIFKVYDADGSGQLDEDEFLQVMKAAGWSDEDALTIFSEVDTDGGGSVELNEFEVWWERNQDINGRTQPPELTLTALASNLERLPTYMRRFGLTEHAAYFEAGLPSIAAAAQAAKAQGYDEALPAPVIKGGDPTQTLNQVADAASARQYRSACKSMYALLLANRTLLPFQANMLQPPGQAVDALSQAQLLALYMCMFAQMLDYQGPEKAAEVEYLYSTAAELWEGPNTASQQTAPGGKAPPKPVESSQEVKDMMRIFYGFYGKQSKLNSARAKEGVFTMSQYLAARKKLKHSPAAANGKDGKGGAPSLLARKGPVLEAVSSLSLYKIAPAMPSLADLRQRLLKEGYAELPSKTTTLPPGCAAGGTAAGVLSGSSAQSRKLAQTMMAMHFGSDLQRSSGASSPVPSAAAAGSSFTSCSYASSDDEVTRVTGASTCSSPVPGSNPVTVPARSSSSLRGPIVTYASRMHMRTGGCTPDPDDWARETVRGSGNGMGWVGRPTCESPRPAPASRRASIDEAPRQSTTLEALTHSLATVSKSGVSSRVRQRSLMLLPDDGSDSSSAPQLTVVLPRNGTPTRRPDPCENAEAAAEPHHQLFQVGSAGLECLDGQSQPQVAPSPCPWSSGISTPQAKLGSAWSSQAQAQAQISATPPPLVSASTLPPCSSARISPPEAGARTPGSTRTSCASPTRLSASVMSGAVDTPSRLRTGFPPAASGNFVTPVAPEPATRSPSGRASCDYHGVAGRFTPAAGCESPAPPDEDGLQASPRPPPPCNRRRSFDCDWAIQARLALASAQVASAPNSGLLEEDPARCQSPTAARPPAGKPPVAGGNARRRSLVELDCSPKQGASTLEGPMSSPASPAAACSPSEKDKWGQRLPSLLLNIIPGRRSKDTTSKNDGGKLLPAI